MVDHQDFFRALFEASRNPYAVLDRNLRIVVVNGAYLEEVGIAREDLVGRHIFDVFPGDPGDENVRRARASFKRVLAEREPDTLPLLRYPIPRPTSEGMVHEERYWSTTHTPILDDEGEVAYILQHATDVTELRKEIRTDKDPSDLVTPLLQVEKGVFRRAEAVQETALALESEYRHLRRLFDQAPGFMCVVRGPEHVFELANEAYYELAGHRDLVGKPVREALPDLEGQGYFELLDRVYETGEPYVGREAEVEVQREPGGEPETVYIDFVFQPIVEPDGSVSGIFSQGHDVTERKRAEAARRHLSAMVEQSEDAIIAKSLDGRIETWNAAAERMYGWTAEEAIGEPATMLVPGEVEAEFEALLEAAAEGKLVQGREIERVRKDGTRFPISLTLSPIRDDEGELIGISGIDRDITELHRHRERLEELVRERTRELEEQEEALRRAEKLEAIGKLTGGVAHDFNNLLHVVDANLQFLRRNLAGSPETRKRLETASAAVERGAELTSQLLSFARRQPLEPRVENPGRLLEEMDGMIRRTLDSSIEVETRVEDGLWNTVVDPHRLENVLLNLVINARDAMEGEGRLTIEFENTRLDEAYAESRADVTPGRYVCLAVSDTGHGMTEEELERAFDPFYTTKEEGTGLGLSMAYGFVKQSGGHIGLYSEPGEGTTVKLYLPHTPEAVDRSDDQREADGSAAGGDETVLVAEDDDDVRATAVEMLEDLGYRVLEAASGENALTVLQSGVEVDLLFTDVVMPGPVRSIELVEQARALFPGLAVLFTSGYTENAIAHRDRLDFDVRLLSKPYEQDELAGAVRQALQDRAGPGEGTPPTPGRGRPAGAELDDADEREGAGRPRERPDASDRRVLVVDDDPLVRRLTREAVEALGPDVLTVADADAAIEAFEDHEVDVLLTDVRLPGQSGLELARALRGRRPDLPVILSSGFSDARIDLEAGDELEDAVRLTKPYHAGDLADALAETLESEDSG